jgi:hypothetical protein
MLLPLMVAAAFHQAIPNVTAKATSEQVKGLFSAQNLCTDKGFPKSRLSVDGYADGGNCWQSGYLDRGPDETPIIEFDLKSVVDVGRFKVWNHNGAPHRGFHRVSVTISKDGKIWTAVAQRFAFAKAPQRDDYAGEDYAFDPPVRARYIRFHCDSTHRTGGQPDLAGLGKVRFFRSKTPATDEKPANGPYPRAAGVIDVTEPPYSANGDGVANDGPAIQRAMDDWQGTHQTVFLPKGTYLTTKPLRFKPGRGTGDNNVRGAGKEATVIRLKDGSFTDPAKPLPVFSMAFNGREDGSGVHADWFNCNVSDLSVHVGRGNPGAIGLQYYSNNVGALRNVAIRSDDDAAAIGLDLGYADQNGPLLVKNVEISGFAVGVRTGATVNCQTAEHVRVAKASNVAWENNGQCLAVRGLRVADSKAGFRSQFGVVAIVDSEFTGGGESAITNGETLFARNVKTKGFAKAIDNQRKTDSPTKSASGGEVDEWVSSPPLSSFDGGRRSLRLPIEETPEPPLDDPNSWANVRCFRRIEDPDDSASLQRAIDSGAETIYFPSGALFHFGSDVGVRGKVKRIVGCQAGVRAIRSKDGRNPVWRIGDGGPSVLVIEGLIGDLRIDHAANRTLVVRDGQGIGGVLSGGGKLFLENITADWEFQRGQAWARQLNNEREGLHVLNAGADLWILGLKTERGGTLIETRKGARTEVLGGLCYTTTQGKLAPMFIVADGGAFSGTIGEVCYSGDPYSMLVKVTRKGETRDLSRGKAPLRPSFLQGSELPLFVSDPADR